MLLLIVCVTQQCVCMYIFTCRATNYYSAYLCKHNSCEKKFSSECLNFLNRSGHDIIKSRNAGHEQQALHENQYQCQIESKMLENTGWRGKRAGEIRPCRGLVSVSLLRSLWIITTDTVRRNLNIKINDLRRPELQL